MNKFTRISEPERCVYEAFFESPAVCDAENAKSILDLLATENAKIAKGEIDDL